MKVRMEGGAVLLLAESAEDHAAMHQLRACGIKSMQMLNSCVEGYGPGLRGPLVIETWPERHGLPGGRPDTGSQSPP